LTPKTPRILSIIIPVYNEYNTLTELVDRVLAVKLPEGMEKQLILVDDYSTDGTRRLYGELRSKVSKILLHKKNQGKGAAMRTG
jgi:glycosyltransferase involved in cell wall biosynthesis